MAALERAPHDRRHAGEREHRLGDEVAGVGPDAVAAVLELLLRGPRPEHDAVAPRLVGRLHDHVGEVVHHVAELGLLAAHPRGHVGDDRILAEVVADDLRHIGVDGLVVGDARAGGVDEGDVAGPVGVHDAGHAHERVGAKRERIEEVVVDPPVDHVDPLEAAGGPHEDDVVLHDEIGALHELDAHLPGEEAMLEVGRVVDARREHDDRRVAGGRRRDVLQHREELLGVVLHGADPLAGEELRKRPLHHLAVFEHVGDARRGAEVVFEDVHHAVATADEVGAGDVAPHALRRLEAGARPPEALARIDEPVGHDAVGDDQPAVVDVVDEEVQGPDPLLEAGLDAGPFTGLDHPRHDVEGPDLLGALLVAVDVEGDAHREQRLLGGPLPRGEIAVGKLGEAADDVLGAGSRLEGVVEELVVKAVGLVGLQIHDGMAAGRGPR